MKLQAKKRELVGKKTKRLRVDNLVPGSVYGPKRASENLVVDKKELKQIFSKVGSNKFFDLELEDQKAVKVLIKDIQIHPVSDQYLSVSFYQVAEDRKMNVEVPVNIIGESPAVKLNLGFLIVQSSELGVHCLPKDLPNEIVIDISKLENPGDAITVEQIQLPEGVEWDSSIDPSSAVVYIAQPQKEEVEEVAPETTEEGEATATTEEGKEEEVKE